MVAALIARWKAVALSHDPASLAALIADDAVFESPVVHTPQRGRDITVRYLTAAGATFADADFRYTGEWTGERSAVLEFTATLDGIHVNGVDMIWWDDAGLITRFKVMVRPLKAVNALHQRMAALLA